MYKYRNNLKLFIFWGVICLLANVVCTASTPYDGDQSFWVGWVQQLIDGGFGGFKGNYPPLYVFWLWVVAQIHAVLNFAVDKTFFLKFICLWPVFFSHLFFVDFLCRITEKFNYPDWKKHLLIAFVALNPAILINGPVWGQVDLLPVVLAVLAIYCISRPRYIFLASMLYLLALLAKFQMIAFLPIFGGLFIRNWRTSWKGLPLAVVGAAVVLLPFAIGGNLLPMLSRAYVQTTSQYPYATMNATNLWVLLVGNAAPDNVPIWGVSADGLGFLLKPAILGKILFVIVSVFVLIKSILCKNIRTAFAHWIYVQESDVKLGRIQIFNNWSPYLVADPEKVWIGLEYFATEGDEMWRMPDDDFIKFAIAELDKIDVARPESVRDAVVFHIKKAYPAYFGTYGEFDKVRSYLDPIDNMFLMGRNGMHKYNNMDHSMLAAMEVVKCIRENSTDKTSLWSVNSEEEYHEGKK